MKKLGTVLGLFILLFFYSNKVIAQLGPLSTFIGYIDTPPLIDGEAETLWSNFGAYPIERPWPLKGISMEGDKVATWQAGWDSENIYILITVPDDNFYPHFEAGVANWLADKPEIYFDVNPIKIEDPAVGASTPNSGHYQFAPSFDSVGVSAPDQYKFAYKIRGDSNYVCEYAIPFASMKDKDGNDFLPENDITIGFDVTIIDLDEPGFGANVTTGHANWSNDMLTANESWVDMTMSGNLTFVNMCCGDVHTKVLENSFVTLYPNPANGLVTISSQQSIQKIEILNLLGGVVLTTTTNTGQVQIDIHELKAGMYAVRIFSEKEMVVKSLLVE